MPTPMTADLILDRFDTLWHDVIGNVDVATTSKQIWLDLGQNESLLGGRFGWTWPAPFRGPDGDTIVVGYCPEILAEITALLDDEDRSEYLNGVQWLWTTYMGDLPDDNALDPALQEDVRARLAKHFPYTAALMERIEARAIEIGLVPSEPGGAVSKTPTCTACGWVNEAGANACELCESSL